MSKFLTERQRDVLDFVKRCYAERGVAPTLREIAEAFGFASTASAQKHVNLLEKKGYLVREKHQKRGLVLPGTTDQGDETGVQLPLLGTIAAGSPIDAVAQDEAIGVPASMLRSGSEHFVLRVSGDSMIEEGILDGDAVVVRRTSLADDGDTVVALLNGEATLKKLYRESRNRIRLQPANPAMSPLIAPARDVRVQGVVIALLRYYSM